MENSVLTENAYQYILDKILDGSIAPGERIREDQIAAEIGISRTPVREAVNQLCQNGFIKYIKRKGLYCIQIERKELELLLDFREDIEEFTYLQCIKVASKEDIASLYKDISDFDNLSEEEKLKKHTQYDINFHIHLAQCTHSSYLCKYVNELETLLIIVRKNLQSNKQQKFIIDDSWKLHRDLVEAIENRDAASVCKINHNHVQLMRDTQLE